MAVAPKNKEGALSMNNDEKIIALLEKLETDISEVKADLSEVKADLFEMKSIQRLHTQKLNSIETAIHYQTDHSIMISDRVRRLEKASGL